MKRIVCWVGRRTSRFFPSIRVTSIHRDAALPSVVRDLVCAVRRRRTSSIVSSRILTPTARSTAYDAAERTPVYACVACADEQQPQCAQPASAQAVCGPVLFTLISHTLEALTRWQPEHTHARARARARFEIVKSKPISCQDRL